MGSDSGTWVNGWQLAHGGSAPLRPGDVLHFGGHAGSAEAFRVKLQHVRYRSGELTGRGYGAVNSGAMVQQA